MGSCVSTDDDIITAQNKSVAVGAKIDEITNQALDMALAGIDQLKQKVTLTFEGISLPNLDQGSKTDPFLVLFSVEEGVKKDMIDRTEIIANTLDPQWVKTMVIDYYFETT